MVSLRVMRGSVPRPVCGHDGHPCEGGRSHAAAPYPWPPRRPGTRFDRLDISIASHLRRWQTTALRASLGIVFVWFGLLKPLGVSPANDLVTRTVYWFDPAWFVPFLGWWEVAIGVCMLVRPLNRAAILLLALQMPGTFLPLVLLPDVCWVRVPWAPSLEGQYIIKNLVLIAAAMAVGGAVRDEPGPRP